MYKDNENESPAWSKLWAAETKMKAIAYLFENQVAQPATYLPEQMNDIHQGLGKIIYDLCDEIANIRRELEEIDITNAQLKIARKRTAPKSKSSNRTI
tara:strand:- start:574 stop:867 length:294 start_codon:yes stop_codon:yes gene_type:complete